MECLLVRKARGSAEDRVVQRGSFLILCPQKRLSIFLFVRSLPSEHGGKERFFLETALGKDGDNPIARQETHLRTGCIERFFLKSSISKDGVSSCA